MIYLYRGPNIAGLMVPVGKTKIQIGLSKNFGSYLYVRYEVDFWMIYDDKVGANNSNNYASII